jgi:hypothetical protein
MNGMAWHGMADLSNVSPLSPPCVEAARILVAWPEAESLRQQAAMAVMGVVGAMVASRPHEFS